MSGQRSSPQRRIDSLPNLNLQSHYRPHLRPLDLASDFSPQKSSPRRVSNNAMLTPPLTPSSSFSESQNTPSTPTDSASALHRDYQDVPEPSSSRLLLVGNVPKSASTDILKAAFKPCGAIKGILVRFQTHQGVVVIAFYDSRDANRAKGYVSRIDIDGSSLDARLVSSADLRKLAPGPNTFIDECEGQLSVTIEGGHATSNEVRDRLASFGDLQSFEICENSYVAEYFDCRCAQAAVDSVSKLMLPNARLRAEIIYEVGDNSHEQPSTPVVDYESTKSHVRGLFFDNSGRVRPRSVSAGESSKPDLSTLRQGSPVDSHSRTTSNTLFFDAIGKLQTKEVAEPSSGTRRSSAPDVSFQQPTDTYPYDYSHSYPELHHPYPHIHSHAPPFPQYEEQSQMTYQHPAYPTYSYPYAPENPYMYASMSNWDYSTPVMSQHPYPIVTSSSHFLPPPIDTSVSAISPPFSPISPISPSPISPLTPSSSKSFGPRLQQRSRGVAANSPTSPAAPPPERNILHLRKIEEGVDTRTTVMIKNIPNKMSDRDLLAFLHKICPRRIDFLYLRMDFQNGCNVGYAFVNFISVQDLLEFAKAKLGVKWNMYSSEKVLQMSYANYQGKEALIEKFKNSCIMDEREAYRPKIFYSTGAKEGLPEPFPAPTHLRRKERGSNNRGTLFLGNKSAITA